MYEFGSYLQITKYFEENSNFVMITDELIESFIKAYDKDKFDSFWEISEYSTEKKIRKFYTLSFDNIVIHHKENSSFFIRLDRKMEGKNIKKYELTIDGIAFYTYGGVEIRLHKEDCLNYIL